MNIKKNKLFRIELNKNKSSLVLTMEQKEV
jgi:hypothetical protein